jgi:Leucine-rich repeat (LRR) protein
VLRLARTGLRASELRTLPHLEGLETLDLSRLELGDEELGWLAAHAPRLQLIKLNFTRVGDASLEALSRLPSLRRIDLGKTLITDAGLRHLASARALTSLDLGLCTLTDDGLRALSLLPLESLFLAGTAVDDAGVLLLPRSLRTLGLVKTKVTRASMTGLAGFPALREVDLRGLDLTEGEVATLRAREISVRLR